MKRITGLGLLLAGFAIVLRAAAPASPDLDTLLRTAVEQKRVPMVVAMVADNRGVVHEHATGAPQDAIFNIASMTKPVTSVAVMQLVEAGKMKLDEPASTYLRELRDVRVRNGGTLRAPKTPVTVRHLLTHTSGFGYEFMNRDVAELVAKKQVPSMMEGGDGFLKAPLVLDPGTQWEYGISTDWLGKLVERVSGKSLDVYFRQEIFTPLRMHDTFFVVPADKRQRLVPQFQRMADGSLVEQPRQPMPDSGPFHGGSGLHSTASDYLRFVRALMAGGDLEGRRILSVSSVAMMSKNQIGSLRIRPMPSLAPQFMVDQAVMPGGPDKFGLGFAINTGTATTARGAHTMSWAGIFNTFFWIDREKQVGAVFMSQLLPFLDPPVQKLLEEFDRAVYASKMRVRSMD